ncbi:hypothetical protein [Alicyclobacillus fodiniaquatilis]|uniref:Uncharacterized protein n=1 Tax=Alicyclobacillus fodiniaquatilis TaxID=1661150 RepID=A0ABW4JLS6_9BACL
MDKKVVKVSLSPIEEAIMLHKVDYNPGKIVHIDPKRPARIEDMPTWAATWLKKQEDEDPEYVTGWGMGKFGDQRQIQWYFVSICIPFV